MDLKSHNLHNRMVSDLRTYEHTNKKNHLPELKIDGVKGSTKNKIQR
jgi:hypothetical protein